MKSLRILLLMGVVLGSALPASAGGLVFEDKVRKTAAKDTAIGDGSGGAKSFGLGISTLSNVTSTTGALMAQVDLNSQNALQILFGLDSVSALDFGLGLLVRHDLNDNPVGLHVGGGAGFSVVAGGFATNNVNVNLVALGGMHFRVPGAPQVEVLADAGATFTAGSAGVNFKLGALSSLLGVSILYHF